MKLSNDNFANENEALLAKANEMLSKLDHSCPDKSLSECGLLNGGSCPIIASVVTSLIARKGIL